MIRRAVWQNGIGIVVCLALCSLSPLTPLSRADDEPTSIAFLEDLTSARTVFWVKSQDKKTRDILYMTSSFDRAQKMLEPYAHGSNMNLPQMRGEYLFYLDETDKLPHASLYQKSSRMTSVPELLVDPEEFGRTTSISNFAVSPDGMKIAVEFSSTENGRNIIRVWHTAKRKFDANTIEDAKIDRDIWLKSGSAFAFRKDFDGSELVILRELDDENDQFQDSVLYRHSGPQARISLNVAGETVVLRRRHSDGTYDALALSVDGLKTSSLLERGDQPFYYVGSIDDRAFYYSIGPEKNGSVFSVPINDFPAARPSKHRLFAPEFPVNGVHLVGENFVIEVASNAKPKLLIFGVDGEYKGEIEPPLGLVWNDFPPGSPAVSGNPMSSIGYYRSTALGASGIYEFNVETLLQKVHWRRISGEAESQIIQETFLSADGTTIPITLVRRNKISVNERRGPVLVWVYGAYGFISWPFHNAFFAAFLDAGGTIAFPHVRGGGVYGPEWQNLGSKRNKINTIMDTVAAVDWLLENGYTSPEKLALMGNSAGSVPVARASFELGEKVAALLLEVPLTDMERYAEWAPFWSREFGDPENEGDLQVLKSISPLRQASEMNSFPATLILAGEKDQTAVPHHAYRLTAVMQSRQLAPKPVMLYSVKNAGHSIGNNKKQRLESWTYELAFLLENLKMDKCSASQGPKPTC